MNESQAKPLTQEGYDFMAAAFEVHNVLGGGLLEEIYQEALEEELRSREIPFRSKVELPVYYKGIQLRKTYIPDLIVFGSMMIELKSGSNIISEHEMQLLNYMRITQSQTGYLVNFGPMGKLKYKRIIIT